MLNLRRLLWRYFAAVFLSAACCLTEGLAGDRATSSVRVEKPAQGQRATDHCEALAAPSDVSVGRVRLTDLADPEPTIHAAPSPEYLIPPSVSRPLPLLQNSQAGEIGPALPFVPRIVAHEVDIASDAAVGTATVADEVPDLASDVIPVLEAPGMAEVPSFQYSTSFHYHEDGSTASPFAFPTQYDGSVPEAEPPLHWQLSEGFLEALTKPIEPMAGITAKLLHTEHVHPETELETHAIGLQPVPSRPPLVIELNDRFLSPGRLSQGICLPTGAVWRPSLWVFGTFRTGINYFDNGTAQPVAEWANSLDLFTQLNLSGTERVFFSIRPLDEQEGAARNFTGYDFRNGGGLDGWNGDVQTLFFEGDFGEVFPNIDPYDTKALDYGFSIGRQPMLFQQGLLMNEDRIDAFTVTSNTSNGNGNLNLRATGVYAWNCINRNGLMGRNVPDNDGQLIGLFTESDFQVATINADAAYVSSDDGFGDLAVIGVSSIKRITGFENVYNSSLHFLASFPTNGETNFAGQGELLFSQFSWTPHHSEDLIYLNTFWAIDEFTSASRGPLAGGPLGQAGLLFSAAGLGRYGAPLNNQANNVAGGSLGYQMFFDHTRQQVVVEVGGRQDTDGADTAAVGTAVRFQRALNQHWFVVVDGFVTKQEERPVGQGTRVEFQMKF